MSDIEALGQLLDRCAQGDQIAFAALYRSTAPQLFALALRMVKRRDLAEEVLQDAFLQVWHHAREYQSDRGSIVTWMMGIVRYRALDKLRQEGRLQRGQAQMADTPWATQDPSAASSLPDPLSALVQSTETQRLLDCLRELQDVQRDSIVLAYFHGYTHEELARYLNAPLGTVKSWVRRGLQRIRDCLN